MLIFVCMFLLYKRVCGYKRDAYLKSKTVCSNRNKSFENQTQLSLVIHNTFLTLGIFSTCAYGHKISFVRIKAQEKERKGSLERLLLSMYVSNINSGKTLTF